MSKKFQTLDQLRKEQEREDGDDEGQQGQTYFAGGERSGMLVEDPSKSQSGRQLMERILKQAASNSPFAPSENASSSSSSAAAAAPTFRGQGNRLGSENDQQGPSAAASSSSPASQSQPAAEPAEPEVVERQLIFWRNGFSIEDGPLMSYDDPESKRVLELIQSGRAPLHLFNVQYGQQAEVKVQHRIEEDYKEPPKVLKLFSGGGQRLGSHVPAVTSSSSTAAVSVEPVTVDPSKPTTSIQVRLADGTRFVAKLNQEHTLAHLLQSIRHHLAQKQQSSQQQQPISLHTQMPARDLTANPEDLKKTVMELGLGGGVVLQR